MDLPLFDQFFIAFRAQLVIVVHEVVVEETFMNPGGVVVIKVLDEVVAADAFFAAMEMVDGFNVTRVIINFAGIRVVRNNLELVARVKTAEDSTSGLACATKLVDRRFVVGVITDPADKEGAMPFGVAKLLDGVAQVNRLVNFKRFLFNVATNIVKFKVFAAAGTLGSSVVGDCFEHNEILQLGPLSEIEIFIEFHLSCSAVSPS
jgi:hypothetical protein